LKSGVGTTEEKILSEILDELRRLNARFAVLDPDPSSTLEHLAARAAVGGREDSRRLRRFIEENMMRKKEGSNVG